MFGSITIVFLFQIASVQMLIAPDNAELVRVAGVIRLKSMGILSTETIVLLPEKFCWFKS